MPSHAGTDNRILNGRLIWSGLRRILLLQLAAGAVASSAAAWWQGPVIAAGVAYGIGFSMLNAFWLAQRMDRASRLDRANSQRVVYAGAVQRFLFLLLALFAAYRLGLHLLAVAAGMLVAQMAIFVYALSGASESVQDQGELKD
ncbi:MAG TPA: ATP synthase subunit I [Mariprofundaceae bacterium]|nr:ATP synthase subunit I [Mariprofundaceae bacterium]